MLLLLLQLLIGIVLTSVPCLLYPYLFIGREIFVAAVQSIRPLSAASLDPNCDVSPPNPGVVEGEEEVSPSMPMSIARLITRRFKMVQWLVSEPFARLCAKPNCRRAYVLCAAPMTDLVSNRPGKAFYRAP